ncbi:MAG TPA: sodium:proton antiporter [Steroidobacteraceae bacterium]|nr:sodium:proton antiporter [Steroidobacteraceae bacterium]
MSFIGWMAFIGALLLTMALSSAWIRRLPISTAAIYLGIGCSIGPWGFDLLRIDLSHGAPWLERLTEVAVILSLFIGGLRLRLPLTDYAWRAAYRLAGIVMLATIVGVALFAVVVLDLPPALAVLIGSILAPTDPVLASSVTVGHSQDNDRLRYALSGEAGLNDGAAFPFVVLGLLLLSPDLTAGELVQWSVQRVVWAIPAGLTVGYVLGRLVGSAAIALRTRNRDTAAPTDFLVLALIALSYTVADQIGAWGFLSVFAAGLGLRRTELRTVQSDPHPDAPDSEGDEHPPAETLVAPNIVTEKEIEQPAVAAGVMVAEVFSFGDTLERMLEVLLVVIVGVSLASHWDWRGVLLGCALVALIRPLATVLLLIGSPTTRLQRWLLGWFGIRGIGSLYYLAYSMAHGLPRSSAPELADLTLSVVAVSIVVHGVTSQPLMEWYERRLERGRAASATPVQGEG